MKITKKEILAKFNADQMAGLLVGANLRNKTDKDLIEYLMEQIKALKEEMKDELVKHTKRKARRH